MILFDIKVLNYLLTSKNNFAYLKTNSALGIEVEILFERNEQKDWNGKPDPQGNAQNPKKDQNRYSRLKINTSHKRHFIDANPFRSIIVYNI